MTENKSEKKKRKIKSIKAPAKNEIISDVQGSYTGVPLDKNDMPVQDADDL